MGLEERYAEELAVIRTQYPSEPVKFTEKPLVVHWGEAMQLLRDAGHEVENSLNFALYSPYVYYIYLQTPSYYYLSLQSLIFRIKR